MMKTMILAIFMILLMSSIASAQVNINVTQHCSDNLTLITTTITGNYISNLTTFETCPYGCSDNLCNPSPATGTIVMFAIAIFSISVYVIYQYYKNKGM